MAFQPGTAAIPATEVELSISCRDLTGSDVLSKSDPMCVTYTKRFGSQRLVEIHRTEMIENSHNPDFTKKIIMPYRFEEQQPLKFEVYDVDSSSTNLADHDFLGEAVCTLGQIIANGKIKLKLQSRTQSNLDKGYIIISAEELSSQKDELNMHFRGKDLDKKKWFFRKSTPFLVFSKSTESGDYIVSHKTESHRHTVNPVWNPIRLPSRNLTNGDQDRNIRIECFDQNSWTGDHSLIGECFITTRSLLEGTKEFDLINPKKQENESGYKNSGKLIVNQFQIRKIYSFMDYLRGGTQLNCSFGIDFTASNGSPQESNSLHYINDSSRPNAYEQAIRAIGVIIQDYDSDKNFPVLGFGARVPPVGQVSHEFFVNMTQNPYCHGVQGVLEAYHNCIRQVQLYGPTNFAPIINHVAKFAQAYPDGSNYFILLIITDGIITDMPQTKSAIIDASALPMSIIIVGVGGADFSAMEILDADTTPLYERGRQAQRDIVQFVPYRDFQSSHDFQTAQAALAKAVLAEIPQQFVSYMRMRGIDPKPPKMGDAVLMPPDPDLLLLN